MAILIQLQGSQEGTIGQPREVLLMNGKLISRQRGVECVMQEEEEQRKVVTSKLDGFAKDALGSLDFVLRKNALNTTTQN